MKRLFLVFTLLLLTVTLTACEDVCVGPECVTGESGGASSDSVLKFMHIDGHGDIVEREAFIMFEFESLEYIKYQVAYLSCTCRDFVVNYWQVAYIVVERNTNTVQYISFGADEDGHYNGGMWGDSSPVPENGKTLEDFTTEFLPWIEGKGLADFEGISVFTNDEYHGIQNTTTITDDDGMIDDFAGSSVSTNNIIRIVKTILDYHQEKYN